MSKQEPAIVVQDLYKSFKLPHEQHSGIKQLIVDFKKRKKGYEVQHVLNDVSFEIKKGEFFGIVGRNGSGKSTLLKLLAGIYVPDKGLVQVNGALTPFIELGVGFNPELTGRENVFMNGAMLGFGHKEMEAMYDDIVSFAELEKFMDQKLKNYSSGMQVRLAFSIAIRAKSDILLIDEVLAVGDVAFQQKCFDYFEKLKHDNTTIILVTHDMSAINKFCTRSLMIDEGKIVEIGSPRKVSTKYLQVNDTQTEKDMKTENVKNQKSYNAKVVLKKEGSFNMGEVALLEIEWPKSYNNVQNVGIALFKNSGEYVFGANTILDKKHIKGNRISYEVSLNVGPGMYHFKIGLFGKDDTKIIEFIDDGPKLTVKGSKLTWEGITYLNHKWGVKE